jgi:hypothetical protein
MHSILAATIEGVPLALTAIEFWTRTKFKGCIPLKREINRMRVPIEEKESYRWLENLRPSTGLLEAAWVLCPYWRLGKRHVRIVLYGAWPGYAFSGEYLC